jgi:hypothetical protein
MSISFVYSTIGIGKEGESIIFLRKGLRKDAVRVY